MPIQSPEDARDVEQHVDAFFGAFPEQRPTVLRRLFAEVLDFQDVLGQLSLATAKSELLPPAAERIAELDGIHVLFIALSGTRINKRDVVEAVKIIQGELGEDMLLLFTNADASQLHWIHPAWGAQSTPTLRRMVVERDLPQRTAYQQISNLFHDHQQGGNLLNAINRAFDVEPVTKDFFREYERLHKRALELVSGFDDPEDTKSFVQTLFNRLMFVYFLSRKGWLKYNGDSDYPNAIWRSYQKEQPDALFYDHRLYHLFFFGLNNPQGRDFNRHFENRDMAARIGEVPFLNGGLFEKTELDKRAGVVVPDEIFESLLTDLFDAFNFTVMESTPFDIEVAVDPEMLGKVFEELVTGRHDSGAYYTPRPVVSFMCREALKGYLETKAPTLTAETISGFVDERATEGIGVPEAQQIASALAEVTVVDPACGSGAYLLGMMHELVELQQTLFNVGVDAKSLYDLKLQIIERNLYGVDIDPFAVNIAMLRLWLSLAIDYDGDQPKPLPNLDFKILQGDSLLGPDPSQLNLDRHAINQSGLRTLKRMYFSEADGRLKQMHKQDILAKEEELTRSIRGFKVEQDAFDWRIKFAEVVGLGGFDIAIANPPYISFPKNKELSAYYSQCDFGTYAKTGDIYQLFYERGCQLLRSSNAMLVFITSNSWLRAPYGKKTRQLLSNWHRPLRYIDLGKDVFDTAIVDSGILLLRTATTDAGPQPFPSVDMDMLPGVNFPPPADQWGETRQNDDSPWSVLSQVEWSVMQKMQRIGSPLKDWDVKINYGIKTGYNEAFIIDTPTRDRLVAEDPKSAEIIKPVLRGRDVRRYRAQWAGLWLIDTHNGYDNVRPVNVHEYRSIKQHLDQYYSRLESRYDKGHTPYNLRHCAYHKDFGKEKLIWMDMASSASFAYSEDEVFTNNAVYMIVGMDLKYLSGILNSVMSIWYMRHTARTTGLGLTIWHKVYTEQIPVPKWEERSRHHIVNLVDQAIAAKDADPDADTSDLEREIDRLVYDLYGLTEEEIAAVERRVGASC